MTGHESRSTGRVSTADSARANRSVIRVPTAWLLLAGGLGAAILAIALVDPFGDSTDERSSRRPPPGEEKPPPPRSEEPSPAARQPLPKPAPVTPAPVTAEPEPVAAAPDPVAPGPDAETQFTAAGLKKEAIEVLQRLAADFPNNAEPLGLMGNTYVSLGNTAEAIKCWQRCVELDPGNGDSFRCMAKIALKKGEFEKALALSQRGVRADPTVPGLHNQSGQALIGLGRPQEAVAELEKDIKISPQASLSYFLLGQAHQQLEAFEKAKTYYHAALQIKPDYTEACYGIIVVCVRLGQQEELAAYREKFKELKAADWKNLLDSGDARNDERFLALMRRSVARTHTDAARLYAEHRRLRTAEKHWRRAAVLDPKATQCRESLVSLYQQGGRHREAIRVSEQLRDIAPHHARYHLNVGILYARANRIDDALAAVTRAIELEPANPRFRQALKQIQERK